MRSVIKVYKDFGRGMKGFMGRKSAPFLKGTEPPIWQTPGKLQYYKAEMEPYVPDEIKWQLRLPTRFAIREAKLNYLSKVEEEATKFIEHRLKHNYLHPDQQLSLDLTLGEAEILASANQEVVKAAESGALAKIHHKYDDLSKRIDGDYLAARNHISKVLVQIEEKENALYSQLEELGIEKIRKHAEGSWFDVFGLSFEDPLFENISLVEAAIQNGHQASEQLKTIHQKLMVYAGLKARYFEIKVELRDEYNKKVAKNDPDSADELKSLVSLRDRYAATFSRQPVQDEEYTAYINTLGEIVNTKMRKLVMDFAEYEKAHNERERIYHSFTKDHQSEALDVFREELLQHLAGSIVVKEHRLRYQKEQFDRFMLSLQFGKLKNKNLTLKQFCHEYANLIEVLIEDSHNDKCPKIEANYDDFSERTLRPFNATIFYYFFSGDRRGRTIAQWLLSAARYPNDRVRKAYMRFFA